MMGMVSTNVSGTRPYGGVDAADRRASRRARLLEAGLDLLGAEVPQVPELTVRGVCRQAGLTARYFYESFADKDEFVSAVFDSVIADLAAKTQSIVKSAPPDQQTRAGMANIVRTIAGDARIGRLLFGVHLSNAVVVRKRVESSALLAMLSGQHAGSVLRLPENDRIKAAGHFVVGGVAQTISAWLAGEVRFQPERLIEQLAALLDKLGDPALYRD
ncbi:TetR/AcrR family transcriptional regulator [Mycolicibacter kumamotonensis]|jgi:AcrR family transcriptional regulator|uniref:TetR family transcriptional regulator n=1 Tax=Mycolicibacter kumamotonensis TaxID=354243 RepID=A0A1B8SH65_9MYCO|nr:TetR/AcrR family transcriptional regulator [Mycolicibacter kumamotonensis]OBY32092.1 TetR family transcriptional regulator [Mycolicibacter kumamotonensis]